MSASQRTKGRAGEQEVARLLRDALGLDIKRNWQAQSAEGGHDINGVPDWAIEVKRAKHERAREWWRQAVDQAGNLRPALIYRIDGVGRGLSPAMKWSVVCRLKDLGCPAGGDHPAQMTLEAWIQIVRHQNNVED